MDNVLNNYNILSAIKTTALRLKIIIFIIRINSEELCPPRPLKPHQIRKEYYPPKPCAVRCGSAAETSAKQKYRHIRFKLLLLTAIRLFSFINFTKTIDFYAFMC